MDNIAEGFDDGSTREFIRFLAYAQRSCSEVQSQLIPGPGFKIHHSRSVWSSVRDSLRMSQTDQGV